MGRQDRHALQSQAVSTSPSPPTSVLGLLFLPVSPPHWFSTHVLMVAHSTLVEVPHLQQIHTQALAENRTQPQQSAHTLQLHLPFPHAKFLPFHKSQLPSPTHKTVISPTVCTCPFRSSKTEQVRQLYGIKPVFQRCCQLWIRFSSYSFFITTTTVEAPSLHKVDRTDMLD